MTFKALVVRKLDDEKPVAKVEDITLEDLPEGDVLVDVEYSTLNYKDGLCMGPSAGLVRNYPHVPGIDMAGRVTQSADARYKPGDKVVLTGWRYGEVHWGGYAQKTRVPADWLVKLPEALSTKYAMAIGTAGITAMFAIMALEDQGLQKGDGPVLVTGAAGGVGSVATGILANIGYEVAVVSGRAEASDYLKALGASQIIARDEINETVKRPLESEAWAACIDAVGGAMLARLLGQMKYGGTVAAVGLAGGASVPASIMPFLLRGINLVGIDSVMMPFSRRMQAWERISQDLPLEMLDKMIIEAPLGDLPELGRNILKGQVQGRVVIDVNS